MQPRLSGCLILLLPCAFCDCGHWAFQDVKEKFNEMWTIQTRVGQEISVSTIHERGGEILKAQIFFTRTHTQAFQSQVTWWLPCGPARMGPPSPPTLTTSLCDLFAMDHMALGDDAADRLHCLKGSELHLVAWQPMSKANGSEAFMTLAEMSGLLPL